MVVTEKRNSIDNGIGLWQVSRQIRGRVLVPWQELNLVLARDSQADSCCRAPSNNGSYISLHIELEVPSAVSYAHAPSRAFRHCSC